MKGTLRLIIVLGVISILSGLALAGTSILTQPKIEQAAQQKLEQAIFEVLPKAKEYQKIDNSSIEMYEGYDDAGNVVGIAFVSEASGFQGDISLIAGVDIEQQVLTGISVLSHSETPGLGARITEPVFTDQFKDKPINDDYLVKQDIDAITGATISSEAVTDALKKNIDIILEEYKKGGGN